MTPHCVVEFHGFKTYRNQRIAKEFAVVGDLTTFYTVFKSPYSKANIKCHKTRGSIAWLEINYHMVQWDDGVTIFNHDVIKKLLKPFHEVCTTGLEKTSFLISFTTI